jgi:hypothetical protein
LTIRSRFPDRLLPAGLRLSRYAEVGSMDSYRLCSAVSCQLSDTPFRI